MFVRVKKSGAYQYLQIVQNERANGQVQQHVIATLGRLDVLQRTGQLDALLCSCARFAEHSAVLSAHRQGRLAATQKVSIGPALVFERLWQELGFPIDGQKKNATRPTNGRPDLQQKRQSHVALLF